MPTIEVSPGELLDRAAILWLKTFKVADPEKARRARAQLDALRPALDAIDRESVRPWEDALKLANARLWALEDQIRRLGKSGLAGPLYVETAGAIREWNERRHELKTQIDERLGCATLAEVKQYT